MAGLGLGLGLRIRQSQKLSIAQRQTLKALIKLGQELRHPEYPNMLKGLDGMRRGNGILKERQSAGVLIGGLSEAVWNYRRKPGDLYKHKDVDIMVLNDGFRLSDNFEGGIDWWLPKGAEVNVRGAYSPLGKVYSKWWENGNEVVLRFGADVKYPLEPGLYIPDSGWVIGMRESETSAGIDYASLGVEEADDDVFEEFRNHMKKRIKTALPTYIQEEFKGQILSGKYEKEDKKAHSPIEIVIFDKYTLAAIKEFKEKYTEK